jgi:aspartate 1-decarboxylase
MVHVWNIDSGERLVTSATKGLPGSGIALNGSAARNSVVGDLIIVAAFSQVAQHDALALKPQLVCVYETSRQLRPRLFEAGRAVA